MAGGATNFRDAFLPALDVIRSIPAVLGLRLYVVTIWTRSWSGTRPGLGTSTDTTTGVKIDLGTYQTKVVQLNSRDIVASGGLYRAEDMAVGPITPPYTGSAADNDAIAILDPQYGANPQELFFEISGPGLAGANNWFKRVSLNVSKPFRYEFVVRRTSALP